MKEHTSTVTMFFNRDSGVRTCRLISSVSMFRSVRLIETIPDERHVIANDRVGEINRKFRTHAFVMLCSTKENIGRGQVAGVGVGA